MIKRTIALVLLTMAASSGAGAADFGLYGEAGTFGAGGGVAVQLTDRFSLRAGYSAFTYDVKDYQAEDLSFDGKAKVRAGKLLLDWYALGGGFRIGAGVMLNDSSASAVARPVADGYTINGTFYPSSQIATADGRVEFDAVAPYVGIGFGRALNTSGRLNFLLDVGVALTGEPTVTLDVDCGSVPAAVCAEVQDGVAVEQARVQEDADTMKLWPHVNVALSWRF